MLLAELEKRALERMVAKRADHLNIGGCTRDWLKMRTMAQEVSIGCSAQVQRDSYACMRVTATVLIFS